MRRLENKGSGSAGGCIVQSRSALEFVATLAVADAPDCQGSEKSDP